MESWMIVALGIAGILVIPFSIVAVKVSINFDFVKWREATRKSRREKLKIEMQGICPHPQQSLVYQPTLMSFCGQCQYVFLNNVWHVSDKEEAGRRQKEFRKLHVKFRKNL